VVFGFLAIFELRYSHGGVDSVPGLPTNVLLAMGISVATAVSAKSIAVKSQAKSDAAAAAADTPTGQVVAAVVAPTADDPGMR